MTSHDDAPRLAASATPHGGGTKTIYGGGMHWTVREAAYPAYDRRHQTCLIFENDQVVRRVRTFPPNWRERSDDELYALSLVF